MYMNGAVIGMAVIHRHHKLILPDRHLALTACFVGVVGTTMLSTAECRIATTTTRSTATATTASALSFVLNLINLPKRCMHSSLVLWKLSFKNIQVAIRKN